MINITNHGSLRLQQRFGLKNISDQRKFLTTVMATGNYSDGDTRNEPGVFSINYNSADYIFRRDGNKNYFITVKIQ